VTKKKRSIIFPPDDPRQQDVLGAGDDHRQHATVCQREGEDGSGISNCRKTFVFDVNYLSSKRRRMFVLGQTFLPNVVFVS
jgi:hypothetical protein